MKKLFTIIILSLMWNEYSFAKDDKEFFISCSAKGYQDISYKQQRFTETLFDEYKIVIGKGDPDLMLSATGRVPKSTLLVNTNADKEQNFFLVKFFKFLL